MQRKCLKCNMVKDNATGDALEACPTCGAIYSRVEAARSAGDSGPSSRFGSSRLPAAPTVDVSSFADAMRSTSLYPTFRSLVKLFYVLWVFLAVCAAIGGAVGLILNSGPARFWSLFGGLFGALLFVFIARITREVSLMLADLSDAAVRLAARQEIGTTT